MNAMADDIDFIALYQELDCIPDQGVDAFRHAWRRRVAHLHPDRSGAGGTLELQRLNAAYAAAMEFHARNGRLPGESHMGGAMPSARIGVAAPIEEPDRSGPGHARWLLLLPLMALGLFWLAERNNDDGATSRETTTAATPRGGPVTRLRLGLRQDQVLALLGEPVSRNATLWQWGPSWVAFECGQVVDWYSSRLRPLKTAGEVPSDAEKRNAPPRVRCAPSLPEGVP